MNDKENKKKKGFGSEGKRDKEGRKDPHERKPGIRDGLLIPSGDEVTAVSVMELPFSSVVGDNYFAYPLVVLHSELYVQAFYSRAMSNHSSIVRNTIKKIAASYFAQVSPTTISAIETMVESVVVASMKVFALICYLWKVQNGLQFEDEDGYRLKNALYGCYALYDGVGKETYYGDQIMGRTITGDYAISNAAWKKDILSRLNKIYLSDKFAEFAYTVIGHFIQFDYGDEESIRLWDIFPNDLAISMHVATTTPTYNDIVTLLNQYEATIDQAYNTYPFMEQVLEMLGFKKPGDKYDFTRDLAQMKLNILKDRDHALENLCFMTSNERSTATELDPTAPYWRVVSTQIPSSAFKFYEDDREYAQNLIYFDRITTNIKSLTNALRGCLRSMFVSVFQKNTAATKTIWVTGPNIVNYTGSTINEDDVAKMLAIHQTNLALNLLDLPNDLVIITVYNLSNVALYDENGSMYSTGGPLKVHAGGGVYIINENDINSIISDACAFLLFESQAVPSTMQTLGNDGKN